MHVHNCNTLYWYDLYPCKYNRLSTNIYLGKTVPQNKSEDGNVARIRLLFNKYAVGASTLLRINVISATFSHEAYLPDFDICTKYTDILQRCTKHIDFLKQTEFLFLLVRFL